MKKEKVDVFEIIQPSSGVKILLIRLDHLGDLVLMTPLVRALAKAGHSVDILTLRWLGAVFENSPYIKGNFALEEIDPSFLKNDRALQCWLKSQKYDVLLLPNPKPRRLLWSSFRSGVPVRMAMQAGIWGRLTGHRCLTVHSSMMSGRHFSDLQLDFARALDVPTDGLRLDYFCREEEIAQAKKNLSSVFPDSGSEPLIGIHPGTQGNTCNLPPTVYGELAALILARTPWRIVLTGSAGEKKLLDSWPREVLQSPRVYNTMGALDLRSLAALISQMDRYVIGSTGPLHLAAALGIKTLSPFCPLPPIAASIWGNIATGVCAEPEAESCRQWRAGAPPHQHCNFRGEITVERLWTLLNENRRP